MDKCAVGYLDATITSPPNLGKRELQSVARQFLDQVEKKISTNGGTGITFQLEWAKSGCIRLRAKMFINNVGKLAVETAKIALNGSGVIVAGAIGVYSVLPEDAKQAVLDTFQSSEEPFVCEARGEEFACAVIKCHVIFNDERYVTKEGDTLKDIVANVWKVPFEEQKKFVWQLKSRYKNILLDRETGVLRPGQLMSFSKHKRCV